MSKRASRSGNAKTGTFGFGCFLLFGIPFLVAGLAMSGLFFYTAAKALQARWWVKTPCTVESAELESRMGDESVTWLTNARYSWNWEGSVYRSDRVSFSPGSDNVGGFQKNAAKELKSVLGKPDGFYCLVNPLIPREAVLYRDMRWEMVLFQLPFLVMFPTVGAGLIFATISMQRRVRRDESARAENPDTPHRWRSDWSGDFVEDRGRGRSPYVRILLAWCTLALGISFASLFLTDTWETGRRITAAALGIAYAAMLIFTMRLFRAVSRYGKLTFIPDAGSVPLSPGRRMTGMIPLPAPLRHAPDVKAFVRVTRAEEEFIKTLAKTDAAVDQHPTWIGIDVLLPQAPGCSPPALSREVTWWLEVKASRDGLRGAFDLPVFDQGQPGDPRATGN
jgi:hypothetical protein